jgi:hypothetical protein
MSLENKGGFIPGSKDQKKAEELKKTKRKIGLAGSLVVGGLGLLAAERAGVFDHKKEDVSASSQDKNVVSKEGKTRLNNLVRDAGLIGVALKESGVAQRPDIVETPQKFSNYDELQAYIQKKLPNQGLVIEELVTKNRKGEIKRAEHFLQREDYSFITHINLEVDGTVTIGQVSFGDTDTNVSPQDFDRTLKAKMHMAELNRDFMAAEGEELRMTIKKDVIAAAREAGIPFDEEKYLKLGLPEENKKNEEKP